MKKKVLFVDDEVMVLKGMERMLHSLRGEWEMEFLESGSQALERMTQTPFDVIVSDMRMPGMNGAELLTTVMQRHPRTVRLILSGHADTELILKCVGSAHQFLSKPCNAESLKAAVTRAFGLESFLENDKLKQLVSRINPIPSIPAIYVELVETTHDPDARIETIGAIIGKDMAMTAQILKLVNSAFFGIQRQISSPAEATTYLGLDTIRSLVLSISAFSQFESTNIAGFSLERLWTHSLDTAAAAKTIARMEGADQKLTDEAFVAGMLHDIGKLVLAANFPDQFREVVRLTREESTAYGDAEYQIFGASHADVGGNILGLWGLPVPVVEAIALHHQPNHATANVFTPLTAVHVANALIHARDAGHAEVDCAGELNITYLTEIGLYERRDAWYHEVQALPTGNPHP